LKLDLFRPGKEKETLQLQIKQRRTTTSTEVVYQVLWPKTRAGEALLLRQTQGQPSSGTLVTQANGVQSLGEQQMKESMFGSELSYRDVLENFFSWDQQNFVGTDVVDRVPCQILESKPGEGQRSDYSVVSTWVDLRRLVPMRVEKYLATGQLARRIETTLVVKDDKDRSIPANITVGGTQNGTRTDLEGSWMRHDVTYSDRDFSSEGLANLKPPGL